MPAQTATATASATRLRGTWPFVFVTEADTQTDAFKMTMVCPSHIMGTPEAAMEKLTAVRQSLSHGQEIRLWICRSDQLNSVKTFSPIADTIVVNPFAVPEGSPSSPLGEGVWAGYDQPLLNELRDIRLGAGGIRVLACIDINGEPGLFSKRRVAYEEIEWMVCATVGAGFQGVCWRPDRAPAAWPQRVKQLEQDIGRYSSDLAEAVPVTWAKAHSGQPVSALASRKLLLVTLLNAHYMQVPQRGKDVALPVETPTTQADVSITPPAGVAIRGGSTLAGMTIPLERAAGSVRVRHLVKGGGDTLVFSLDDTSSGSARRSDGPTAKPPETKIHDASNR